MLAQSAIHETSGASPTAAQASGTKAKKKPGLLAGLFPDMLSQARKGQGPRGNEGSEASRQSERKAEARDHLEAKDARKGGGLAKPSPAGTAHAAESLASSADSRSAEEARARKKNDKKISGQPDELALADAPVQKNADDRRRLRAVKDAQPDEALASRAQRVAARPGAAEAAQSAAKAKAEAVDAEPKVEEKKRGRPEQDAKLNFLDLRRSVEARRAAAESSSKADAKSEDLSIKETAREPKPGAQGQELVRDLSLDAHKADAASSPAKADRPSVAGGQDFQSMLADRLREAWNGEIVKSAHIVLRDGDAGTIRLRLRPESLGNVKVELNLADNNISGRILVESDEAKTAFERNMNQLADAFRQGGFDSARLEVAVGGGSGNGASGGKAGDPAGPFYSERLRSAVGSSAEPATAATAYARRGGAVDILA
jgi:flagellar hook-length control protein FliK